MKLITRVIKHTSWVIKKKKRWLDEECLGERNSHSPSSRHILRLLVDSLLVETKTSKDLGCSNLKGRWVHIIDTLLSC